MAHDVVSGLNPYRVLISDVVLTMYDDVARDVRALGKAAIRFGLRGPNVTFNQREASAFGALAFSVGAIRQGRVAAMVTGGADRLEATFYKVHDRFRALSPMPHRSTAACAPRMAS